MENETILTPEGKQKLEEELAYREGELSTQIIERIKEARAFGDLSENSEYDAAKEEQSKNEARLAELRHILAVAKVQDSATAGDQGVSIGCAVELKDAKGKVTSFTIVGTTETNSIKHRISDKSPAGAALIGCHEGDEVEFVSPSGKTLHYTIVKVSR